MEYARTLAGGVSGCGHGSQSLKPWTSGVWIQTHTSQQSRGAKGAVIRRSCVVSSPEKSASARVVRSGDHISVSLMLCTITVWSVLSEVFLALKGVPTRAWIGTVCVCVGVVDCSVNSILVVVIGTAQSANLLPLPPVLCLLIPGPSQPNSLDICLHQVPPSPLGAMPGSWSHKPSKQELLWHPAVFHPCYMS